MNYLKFMALLSILFLAACSTENEAAVEATETEAENTETEAVSYTHLTLPTSRSV